VTRHGRATLARTAAACALASLGIAGAARADEPLAQATLSYAVAPGAEACPTEEVLRQLVALRLGYDPFVPAAAKGVGVAIARDARGYNAHITTSTDHGAPAARDIVSEGGSCDELAQSVVLAVSLAVDPRSFAGPRRPPPSPPTPPPPLPPPPPADDAQPAPPPPPPGRLPPPATPWTIEVDVGARAGFGVVPTPSLGPVLDFRLARRAFALVVDAGADLPTGNASKPSVTPGTVNASLLWAGAGLCAMPRIFFACGRLDIGATEGTGQVLAQHTGVTPYSGLGLLAGAIYEPAPGYRASLRAELLAPFTRTTLNLAGDPIWVTPPVAGTVGVTFGYRY